MRTDEDVDANAFTQNPRRAPAVMEPLTFTPARASPGTVAFAPYAHPHPSAGPGAPIPAPWAEDGFADSALSPHRRQGKRLL